jgi:hypothetical protein
MTAMKRWILGPLLVLSGLAMTGCADDTPGLFIRGNTLLTTDCEVNATGATRDFRSLGTLDLFIAQNYVMAPLIESTLVESETVSFGSTGGGQGLTGTDWEANSVSLTHAEIKYDVPEAIGIELLNGVTLPLSGAVGPGDFVGISIEPIGESVGRILARSQFLRTSSTSIPMNLRITFHGRTVAGRKVESNEFVYPINLCYQCLLGTPASVIDSGYFIQPNCRNRVIGEEEETLLSSPFSTDACFPGQDEVVDCRIVCPSLAGTETDEEGICGTN